jgi:hypothetical protein
VGTAGPAFAQSTPPAFVRGFGGLTFMSEPAEVFGVGVGFRIHPNVDAIGELGRLTNVLPRELQRDLDDAAHAIGDRPRHRGGRAIRSTVARRTRQAR